MITERDLKEAIAECEGTKNPNANTCIKLAAYYTILENLYGMESKNVDFSPRYAQRAYSLSDGEEQSFLTDSELSDFIRTKGLEKCFPVLDDLMNTLYVLNPKLYDSVLRKLAEL